MSVPKISSGTVGMMACSLLPMMSRDDFEDMVFRADVKSYGSSMTLKEIALSKAAHLACDLAEAIVFEMEIREQNYVKKSHKAEK